MAEREQNRDDVPGMSRLRGSSAVGNLLLVLLSLLITGGAIELGLRIAGYDPLRHLKTGRELILQPSRNSDVKYELVPGASARAWGTQVSINAQGYRGHMASASFAGYRIIALGDSITFGNDLPVEATYASQAQEMLDKSASRYEVLNFGVGGYDILQEVSLLAYRGLPLKPSLVVVGFCLNDVGIASPNLEYIERLQKYAPGTLLSASRLAQFVVSNLDRVRLGKWMEAKNRPEVFARDYAGRIAPIADDSEVRALMRQVPKDYPSTLYESTARIGRLRYAFEYLAGLAEREGFAVVVLPVPWLVGNGHDYPHRIAHEIVKSEARRVGFDVIDVVPDFMDAGMENLRIGRRDLVHPNEKGHRIIAEKLVRYVQDKQPQSGVAQGPLSRGTNSAQ